MVPTSETSANRPAPDAREYRPPESSFIIGRAGLVFFLFLTGLAIALPLLDPGGSFTHAVLAAVIFSCISGAFVALSLYLILSYRRMRLYTTDAVIRHIGIWRSQTVPLAEVTRAIWRGWPAGGNLVLHTRERRLNVTFANYENPADLAAFFRAALPVAVQHRYERFEAANVPDSQAFRRRQDREERWFIAVLPIAVLGAVALIVWDPWKGWVRSCLGYPIGMLIVMGVQALYVRWRARKAAARMRQASRH